MINVVLYVRARNATTDDITSFDMGSYNHHIDIVFSACKNVWMYMQHDLNGKYRNYNGVGDPAVDNYSWLDEPGINQRFFVCDMPDNMDKSEYQTFCIYASEQQTSETGDIGALKRYSALSVKEVMCIMDMKKSLAYEVIVQSNIFNGDGEVIDILDI